MPKKIDENKIIDLYILFLKGYKYSRISQILNISVNTVKTYCKNKNKIELKKECENYLFKLQMDAKELLSNYFKTRDRIEVLQNNLREIGEVKNDKNYCKI